MLAVCITHPIDQTKIRSQTQSIRLGMLTTARSTITQSGVLGLWTGLSGSLLRQATYGFTRFSVYAWLKERDDKAGRGKSRVGLVKNGIIAGFFAGIVGSPGGQFPIFETYSELSVLTGCDFPIELVMVRLCSDDLKPPSQRLYYKNALHGLYRIAKDEGWSQTFRGLGATCARSVIMNGAQLSW